MDNIFDFTVTDQDEGANANYVLRIGGGNVNDVFSIDGDSLMADTSKIDYESLADQEFQYTLTILAVDTPGDGQPMTGTAIIVVKVGVWHLHNSHVRVALNQSVCQVVSQRVSQSVGQFVSQSGG